MPKNDELKIPAFEKTPEAIDKTTSSLLTEIQNEIDRIGSLDDSLITFETVIEKLDQLRHQEGTTMSRIYLLQNVSPDASLRDAAEKAYIRYQEWAVEKAYHADVYRAIEKLRKKNLALSKEQSRLLEDEWNDLKRLGLHLDQKTQDQLKALQKKLSQIESEFSTAINEYHDEIWVDPSELKGLSSDILQGFKKNAQGQVRVSLQYPEYLPVMEFCESETIRKELLLRKYRTAAATNRSRLQEMVSLRNQIAKLLEYPSWNHYVLADRMAKTPEKVLAFLDSFETRLRPKAMAELNLLKELKAKHSSPQTAFHAWDYSFYMSLYKKANFEIDHQELKKYFPLDLVLNGLFQFIEKLFSLKISERKDSFPSWADGIRFFEVKDSKSHEVLGGFFLDGFPRPGKYGHAAAFSVVDGKKLSDRYEKPISAMICNFPADGEKLLSHQDVETLFHEFGHILHGVLTKSSYSKFSGTSVAWDFVEAPSQVLENWAWEFEILKTISRTPTQAEPLDINKIEKLKKSNKAGIGLFYLRQISFAKADLEIHGPEVPKDVCKTIDRVLSETFLPVPEDTCFGAGFGHLVGYASGYYGYAWADVMAADMYSLFPKHSLTDEKIGFKLRTDIFEPGSSRDENESLESFLGRPLKSDAFFEHLGLNS